MAQVNGNTEQQPPTDQPSEDTAPQDSQSQPQSQPQQHHKDSQPQNLTDPLVAATSLDDDGSAKRPRDARLIHIILMSLGVNAYQQRVPLMLMDFAYRYTSGVLQDAVHLTSESYGTAAASAPGNKGAQNDTTTVTLQALRLSIASRGQYQFQASLPKEHFTELAAEKNKVALPQITRGSTVRLPPERYRLNGVGYGLAEEWEDEVEEGGIQGLAMAGTNGTGAGDSQMQGVEGEEGAGQADEVMQDA